MAWLSGWKKRIKLDIDYTNKIGASVTWFPVDVFLTATQAEEVFVELTTDAEYKKMQFTQSDGISLLYGHKILFDVSEKLGIFRVSRDGWTINANTSIFLYYDKDHADNDTYIGETNTAACEAVYNAEFKAVYTMEDGVDNAHIYDATSNNNDGTKTGANEPVEAAGKVGKGQDFDGINDKIAIGKLMTNPTEITIEGIFKADDTNAEYRPIAHNNLEPYVSFRINQTGTANKIYVWIHDDVAGVSVESTAYTVTNYNYIAVTGKENDFCKLYVNDDHIDVDVAIGNFATVTIYNNYFGCNRGADSGWFPGIIDEVRFSNVVRSVAWLKGTYNSLWDSLLTYGSEETAFEYVGTGSLTYSGSGSYYYEVPDWEYIGSGTYNFSGVGLYSLGLSYFGIGEFVYSGSAVQVYIICYSYEGIGVFTYLGDAVCRYTVFWSKVTREKEDFTKVEKEIDAWTKVNREKEDWNKVYKE